MKPTKNPADGTACNERAALLAVAEAAQAVYKWYACGCDASRTSINNLSAALAALDQIRGGGK